jgi:hypothetical protein
VILKNPRRLAGGTRIKDIVDLTKGALAEYRFGKKTICTS